MKFHLTWAFRWEPHPSEDAEAAAKEADRAYRDACNLDHRVDEVTEEMAKTRRRNHFAEAIRDSIRRGKPQ